MAAAGDVGVNMGESVFFFTFWFLKATACIQPVGASNDVWVQRCCRLVFHHPETVARSARVFSASDILSLSSKSFHLTQATPHPLCDSKKPPEGVLGRITCERFQWFSLDASISTIERRHAKTICISSSRFAQTCPDIKQGN